MIVKIHRPPEGRKIIAICDDELIGKKFEEGKLQLDLSSSFYKGKEISEEETKNLIKGQCILNVVGKKSMESLTKLNLTENSHIIKIKGIPHTQIIIG